ncbi:sortase [Candidatus Saccharibacteria bacterium]|nr:sortase [Candidatus Saccharibacteria bacterium]
MNPDKSSPDSGTRDVQNTPPQSAAANVIRSQIDDLYSGNPASTPTAATTAADTNPYHRTHSEHPAPQADQWKEYHSAWQNYYQKYYENYYIAQQKPASFVQNQAPAEQPTTIYSNTKAETPESISNDQALYELRQKLLGRVQDSARKIRKSRHFIPIAAALGVVLIFVFIQYNRAFISNVAAYVSPGNIDPQNIVVDPTTDILVGPESRLIIPKINVDVPVTYDVGTDNASQMKAMEGGLAHFPIAGASSHPGEAGNTVLAGHSSNDLFDVGDYKFIFAQLEKLSVGDTIYANYQGKRYSYVVTKTEVVKPTEVNKLVYPTTTPVMTLITCTPLGTALNRLLVTAEQVSPDPAAASAAPAGSGISSGDSPLPGNSPTFLEKLFGAN